MAALQSLTVLYMANNGWCNMKKYTYTVLKYTHDVARGETINVGLLMFCAEESSIRFGIRKHLKEIKLVFPELKYNVLRGYLSGISQQFDRLSRLRSSELNLMGDNILEIATSVLPSDASALRWHSEVRGGISKDIKRTFETLCKTMLDTQAPKAYQRREDDEVWRNFSPILEAAGIKDHLQEKTFKVGKFKQKYDHAFKNGRWHCFVPMSMDYASEDTLMDRVTSEIGKMRLVSENNRETNFYFLFGKPQRENLMAEYNNAKELFFGENSHVVTEDEPENLRSLLRPAIEHFESH